MSRLDPLPDPTDPGALPAPQTPSAPHALRASHEDRDDVVEQLRVAAGDGRLTAEELDERLESALTARTYGELALLVRDLPAVPQPLRAGVPVPAGPPAEVLRLEAKRSNLSRLGPWTVPLRMEVEASGANAVVDFTQAVISHPVLDLAVTLKGSNLRLVVPPGVVVAVEDLAVHGSNVQQRATYPSGAPTLLLVRVSGEARGSNISIRHPRRRRFAEWRARRAARSAGATTLLALGRTLP